MKHVLTTIAIVVASTIVSAGNVDIHKDEVVRPGTGLKSVAIVNAQSRLAQKEIDDVARLLDLSSDINVRTFASSDKDPASLLATSGSEVVVVVKDDTTTPAMLIAPEDRWAIVNVGKLVDDLPSENAKQKFFVPRARKEIIRGFSLLCGGGSSQFPGNIMNVATIRMLDQVKEQIPADMGYHYAEYLTQLGFKPKEWVPYEFACQEGWAPAPTNDVQKAIWDKVHALPTEPIKIKPEEKKTEK